MYEELEQDIKHEVNDIAEDHREEGESIEALKSRIGELEQMVNDLNGKLDQAHKQWVNGQANDYKETKRDYESIKEDLQ